MTTTTVLRTKSGDGALILVHESEEERAESDRLQRAEYEYQASRIVFTPGQLETLRRHKSPSR